MKKIKFSAILLALAVAFPSVAGAEFSDMPQDAEMKSAIERAVYYGILSGYEEDNTVRPNGNITRAEMASIITRACRVDKEADISAFSDVPADKWYHSAMAKAYQMGAFSGDDMQLMHPENNITFQECFTVLSQVFDLIPSFTAKVEAEPSPMPANSVYDSKKQFLFDISNLNSFSDKDSVADWAKVYYSGVIANDGWKGIDGKLTPNEYITRGQFAVVMANLIQTYIDKPGTYIDFPEGVGNVMVRCDGVRLNGIKSHCSVYVADCVSAGQFSMDETELDRIIVRGCASDNADDVGTFLIGSCHTLHVIRPNINVLVSTLPEDIYNDPGSQFSFMFMQD